MIFKGVLATLIYVVCNAGDCAGDALADTSILQRFVRSSNSVTQNCVNGRCSLCVNGKCYNVNGAVSTMSRSKCRDCREVAISGFDCYQNCSSRQLPGGRMRV